MFSFILSSLLYIQITKCRLFLSLKTTLKYNAARIKKCDAHYEQRVNFT